MTQITKAQSHVLESLIGIRGWVGDKELMGMGCNWSSVLSLEKHGLIEVRKIEGQKGYPITQVRFGELCRWFSEVVMCAIQDERTPGDFTWNIMDMGKFTDYFKAGISPEDTVDHFFGLVDSH